MRTVVVVIALAAFTLAHAGPSPATRCTAAKEKAAGKKIAGKMACHAKAKSTGTTVDAACLVKAEAKFVASFARLGVACPGDAASVEVLVDSCVGALVGDVPGDGKCQKASAESIGKWARRLMRCATRDLAERGSFAGCDASADAKGQAARSNAGGCAAPTAHADLHAACVDPIVAALVPIATTITTSTGTTTTPLGSCALTCGGPCDDATQTCVRIFNSGSVTCGCVPTSLCSLGRCVIQSGLCDFGGCPPGYDCFAHSFCLGLPCGDACHCTAPALCFENVP